MKLPANINYLICPNMFGHIVSNFDEIQAKEMSPKKNSLGNSSYTVLSQNRCQTNFTLAQILPNFAPPVAQLEYPAPGGKNIFCPY